METRSSKKRRIEYEKITSSINNTINLRSAETMACPSSINLFDLPVEVLIYLGKFMKIRDIFTFRCYSRYSRELGNAMLSAVRKLHIDSLKKFPRSEMQLRVIVQKCHRLRKMRLILDGDKSFFTDETFENLLINNPYVEQIVLGDMSALPLRALTPIATCCKNLVKITFIGGLLRSEFMKIFYAHNNHILDVNFDFGWESNDVIMRIWEFIKNQPKLQRLSLPGLYGFPDYGSYYDRILSIIAEVCKDLTYLKIPWNINETDLYIGIRKVVDNCPKLKTINFAFNAKLIDELLNYLKSKNIEVIGNNSTLQPKLESEESSDDESFISYYDFGSPDDCDNDDYDDGSYDDGSYDSSD